MFGFRWGFAGNDSRKAFQAIGAGRYTSYSDVREHYKEIADTAQSKLEHLQQRLMDRNSVSGNDGAHTSKTFYDFMEEERNRETGERAREISQAHLRGVVERAAVQPAVASLPVAAPAPVPTPAPAPVVAVAAPPSAGDSSPASLSQLLSQLDALGDNKEAKKNLIQALPAAMRDQVMSALKAKKDEEEARRASERDAELDGLL